MLIVYSSFYSNSPVQKISPPPAEWKCFTESWTKTHFHYRCTTSVTPESFHSSQNWKKKTCQVFLISFQKIWTEPGEQNCFCFLHFLWKWEQHLLFCLIQKNVQHMFWRGDKSLYIYIWNDVQIKCSLCVNTNVGRDKKKLSVSIALLKYFTKTH